MKLAFDIKDQLFVQPSTPIGTTIYQTGNVFDILSVIIKNIYVITGIILFFFIIIGGVGMILSAGDTEKQKQGSKTVTSAVLGYFIMFAAYWLIKIIEIIFGVKILSF
ncbi:MAG: hypothetical protein NTZ93_04300 [Candidatus Beckwithbacteria bacterium]|nr:hypothetical protein [Candidatus Beckwithbacteria bacterium]